MINVDDLKKRFDFGESKRRVIDRIHANEAGSVDFINFFQRYTAWNSVFGSGVASLSGSIGAYQFLFQDQDEPFKAFADRSVYVGSFFFDAARDEFDDRDDPQRDTHRCLAQAFIKGLVTLHAEGNPCESTSLANAWEHRFAEPHWLNKLKMEVLEGYSITMGHPESVFRAMGFHLGSEILADQEFTIFEEWLLTYLPEITQKLKAMKVTVGDGEYSPFRWIQIHSSLGEESGCAEQEHFDVALKGVAYAFKYTPRNMQEEYLANLYDGFQMFVDNHATFFKQA